jgi:uncharacterized SAM-binding protein YcdF (DUF218 family)
MLKTFRCGCVLLFVLLAIVIGALGYFFRAPILRKTASILVVRDEPVHADLIVVHAGERTRLEWAAELYRQGHASRILVFIGPEQESGFFGLTGEEALRLAREAAEKAGVKSSDIVFVRGVSSTWDEGKEAVEYFGKHPEVRAVLVVSNPFHMRRIRSVYRQLLQDRDQPPLIFYVPVPWEQSGLSLKDWWDREREVVWVGSEYVKLIFYYLTHFRTGE